MGPLWFRLVPRSQKGRYCSRLGVCFWHLRYISSEIATDGWKTNATSVQNQAPRAYNICAVASTHQGLTSRDHQRHRLQASPGSLLGRRTVLGPKRTPRERSRDRRIRHSGQTRPPAGAKTGTGRNHKTFDAPKRRQPLKVSAVLPRLRVTSNDAAFYFL